MLYGKDQLFSYKLPCGSIVFFCMISRSTLAINRCTSKIIRSFRRLSAEKKFFIRKFPTVRNWKRYKFSKLKKRFVDTKLPKFTKIGTQRARNSNTANVGLLNEKTSIGENFGCPNVSFATPRPPGGKKKSIDLINFFWSSAAAFVGTGSAKTTSLILTVFDFSQYCAEKNLKTKKFESRLQVKCAPQCPRLVAKIFSLLGTVSGEMLELFQNFWVSNDLRKQIRMKWKTVFWMFNNLSAKEIHLEIHSN